MDSLYGDLPGLGGKAKDGSRPTPPALPFPAFPKWGGGGKGTPAS